MQEQADKIKAEVAAAADYVPMPFNFAQSHDFPPTFSMDDFEGNSVLCVVTSNHLEKSLDPVVELYSLLFNKRWEYSSVINNNTHIYTHTHSSPHRTN